MAYGIDMSDATQDPQVQPADHSDAAESTSPRPLLGPHGVNQAALTRMKSIEGQVRGIQKMIESERYCMDIVDQISAVRAALAKVSENILRRHIETCVVDDLRTGSEAEQRRVVDELVEAVSRRMR